MVLWASSRTVLRCAEFPRPLLVAQSLIITCMYNTGVAYRNKPTWVIGICSSGWSAWSRKDPETSAPRCY